MVPPLAPFEVFVFLALAPLSDAQRSEPTPVEIEVDASDAPRHVLHARLVIPAAPGALTLSYPQWIPGEHGPTGPIVQAVNLHVSANGKALAWRRDLVDLFDHAIEVPQGANRVEVTLDYLSPSATDGFTASASATAKLAVVSWNSLLLYPKGAAADDIQYAATLHLPADWNLATALPIAQRQGESVEFKPVSLTTLIDSPVITGQYLREFELTEADAPARVWLDAVADGEAALQLADAKVAAYRRLVAEANALFGAHHYRDYRFLVTLSDHVSSFGLEHHESSDDRDSERSLIDADAWRGFAGLLPHEYVHSWNGKYRRPAGLATRDYQQPMKDDLLWVYEGLTEYLGYLLTVRSGLETPDEFRDDLAHVAASLDAKGGRTWRPLQDTASAASLLYSAPKEWANRRRGVDFYDEGVLLWLEVDTLLRGESHGAKSIEDFVRAFHGAPSTGPMVKSYTFDDVVTALTSVVPHDWGALLRARLDATGAHAPLGGIESSGWRLAWSETPNGAERAAEAKNKTLALTYSLGLTLDDEGSIVDVVAGAPADQAGLCPGMKLLAVGGRRSTRERIGEALADARAGGRPIDLLVENGDYFIPCRIDYRGGTRHPHLERDPARPDLLQKILSPLVAK
jgi:predicted metalloprotease with PDZ domain